MGKPTIELAVGGAPSEDEHFITWTPLPCTLAVTDTGGSEDPIAVTVRNADAAGGQVEFRVGPGDPRWDELTFELDPAGAEATFEVAGKFGLPSLALGDAAIEVVAAGEPEPLARASIMVRVRKDATTLTSAERDALLSAFVAINAGGGGVYQTLRSVHRDMFSDEAHGDLGFLPWHRAYLLDLERALQAADPAVVLPYWKFDEPAPTLFHPDFLGRSSSTAAPTLSPTNPLLTWQTDGLPGINRRARFDDQTSSADQPGPFRILSETDTIALGPEYTPFIDLEGNPHGYAHTCFSGSIRSIDTAAKDPLFFFLHCNIDRLWAKWQWINQRYDGTKAASFTSTGAAGDPGSTRIGHNRLDTMWPWNGVTSPPRPSTAPRQPFPGSPVVSAPQSKPMVGGLIDFQGEIDAANRLGFAYDDVPYTGP